ncbi:hypothetical protein PIB30_079285 [Stylosanthes scabra]|uniref:Putative plant transposon protein domain-containing protein n=1 Tax=Stylosanthes scabra TaxID=79078 RepID=A0ABU6XT86_9FABA|nr:hypothetical protein [Stylosanthes scabra]
MEEKSKNIIIQGCTTTLYVTPSRITWGFCIPLHFAHSFPTYNAMHHVIRGANSSNSPQMTEAGRYTSQPHIIRGGCFIHAFKTQRPHVICGSTRYTWLHTLYIGRLIEKKGKAVSSSSQVIPRFKTLYHEAHFNSKLSARRILPELILQADENVFNPIRFQIHQRKWEKFTKPIQAVGHLMVKEFYANAWEPDKAKRKPLTYTSMVRGTEISFAPSNIKRGAEWVRHRDGRPHYLRRSDLEPMTKGWYEFVCRSILPTTNRSELTVERAMLIHSIIIGENINVEEIIAE